MANPKSGEGKYSNGSEFSSWVIALSEAVKKKRLKKISIGGLQLKYFTCFNSLWLIYSFNENSHAAIRACFDAAGIISVSFVRNPGQAVKFTVKGNSGIFTVLAQNPKDTKILRCACSIKHKGRLRITYMPRDLYALGKNFDPLKSEGIIHTVQHGPCSGTVFFSLHKPAGGSALYFQNFSNLNRYFQQTRTEPMDITGGLWPEMGTALPICEDNCITSGDITLSDAYINFSPNVPQGEFEVSRMFLDLLAGIYLTINKPRAENYDWHLTAAATLKTIERSKQCYMLVNNKFFLNAYVDNREKPPESMVQLSVLVPMLDYAAFTGSEIKLAERIKKSLEYFYSKRHKTIVRWLPMGKFDKDERSEEEHKDKMDSWYHLHILLNLGRLAEKGDGKIKKIFLDSIDFAIKAARKFRYNWPVFYDMKTFRVIKQETSKGKGGELDVPGIYTHVMLQAYDITKDEKYLKEAKRAAKKLRGLHMQLVYQTNITLFSGIGLARLWKITGDKLYLDLSILCAANVINRFWIWSSGYGHARSYETFMGMLPLHDAKYLALYEESEAMAALYKLVSILRDNAPDSLHLLAAEYVKYLLHRAKYYYPSNLPAEAISEKPRNGKINRELCIPIEDLQHGWEQSGQVGQEVYGSAAPFIFISCAYKKADNLPFTFSCNYPVFDIQFEKKGRLGNLYFHTGGSEKLKCSVRIFPRKGGLKSITVKYKEKHSEKNKTANIRKNEFSVSGNSAVSVVWKE